MARMLAVLGVSMALAVGLASPASAAGASYTCDGDNYNNAANTGCGVALLQSIIDLVRGAQVDRIDREAFVKNVLQSAVDNTGGRYNVMVFDEKDVQPFGGTENHPYTQNLQGVLYSQDFVYRSAWDGADHHFHVWVFGGGSSFDNKWDGGWINWAFSGSWNRPQVDKICNSGSRMPYTCHVPGPVVNFGSMPGWKVSSVTTNMDNGFKCIDDSNSDTNNSNKIDIWDCNGTAAQNIVFAHGTDGVGTLIVLGKCLDLGSSPTWGTHVQLWDCNNTVNQKWVYSDGTLRNPSSGFCLDIAGSNINNGTPLVAWSCSGLRNQQWFGGTL
ncbi:RICIN domain-containing protein [Kitasatospora acidiphila]|nr:RICIN domain-containing protein [Kitasatospora acidiphila]